VIGRAIWTLGSSLPSPYYTLYMLALGATPSDIGLINSLAIIGGMSVEPLGGYIADRRGRVKLVGIFTFGFAICYSIFAFAPDWRFLGIGQILQQMCFFYSPGLNAIMSDSLRPGTRGRGYALERTFPLALSMVAPYLGGLLISHYGTGDAALISAMRQLYILSLIFGLVTAYLRLRYLKETLTSNDPPFKLRELPNVIKDAYTGIWETIKWLPHNFKPIVYLQFIQTFFISMTAPFWIYYAKNTLGITAPEWGTVLLFSGFTGIISIFPIGYLVDRIGSKKMIMISMFLAIISVALFLQATGFWSVTLVLVVLAMSNSIVTPAWASLIADMIPRDRRGRINALVGENGIGVSTSRTTGGGILLVIPASLGASIGGYLIEWNMTVPFMLLLGALIICFLFTFKFVHEPQKAEV